MIRLHRCEQCDDARFHGKEFCEKHAPKTPGQELRALRKKKGLNLAQVADALGVSIELISNFERGIETPSALFLGKLQKLYQCDDGKAPQAEATQEPSPSPPEESATMAKSETEEELRSMGVEPMRYLTGEALAQDLQEWRERIEEHRKNKER